MYQTTQSSISPTGSLRSLRTNHSIATDSQTLHDNLRKSAEFGQMLLMRAHNLENELDQKQNKIYEQENLIQAKDNEISHYKTQILLKDENFDELERRYESAMQELQELKFKYNNKLDENLKLKLNLNSIEGKNYDLEQQLKGEIKWKQHSDNLKLDQTGIGRYTKTGNLINLPDKELIFKREKSMLSQAKLDTGRV